MLELELLPEELQAPKFGDATSSLVCRQSAVKVGSKPALRCYISTNVSSICLDSDQIDTFSNTSCQTSSF